MTTVTDPKSTWRIVYLNTSMLSSVIVMFIQIQQCDKLGLGWVI